VHSYFIGSDTSPDFFRKKRKEKNFIKLRSFLKLKEISNPGYPHDSCKCGSRGSGGRDRKKSKEEAKKYHFFDGRAGQKKEPSAP
jgi:hypothetical protein